MKLSMDYDEDADYDGEYDESEPEEKAVKPVTGILILLGLMAMSAMICAVLWNVTHSDRGKENGENFSVKQTEEVRPDGEPFSESSPKPGSETTPEANEESGFETIPEESGEPDSGTEPEEEPENNASDAADSSGAAEPETMVFTECEETVTPKEVINLRSVPGTAQADTVVAQARNGEILARTGINSDTGWSRVEYNGQVLYAVSNYLTADLAYQPPAAVSDSNSVSTKDGRNIIFTDCDDNVSPKIYVNLRLEPSTSEGNDTVHCRLEYGEVVHRTGISEDSGWSRVEYDGLVLYVVTSYIYVVEDSQ